MGLIRVDTSSADERVTDALDMLHGCAYAPVTMPTLTKRQRELAALIADGRRASEIAEELGLTRGTVESYTHELYVKLRVRNRTELAMWWRDQAEASA